jgi:hypothetical protein
VRSGDATWVHGPAAFVLAPETDAFGAESMARRLRAIAGDVLGLPVDLRIAAFPRDGLTDHALRASLTARDRRFRVDGNGNGNGNGWVVPLTEPAHAPHLREGAD